MCVCGQGKGCGESVNEYWVGREGDLYILFRLYHFVFSPMLSCFCVSCLFCLSRVCYCLVPSVSCCGCASENRGRQGGVGDEKDGRKVVSGERETAREREGGRQRERYSYSYLIFFLLELFGLVTFRPVRLA